MHRPLQQRRLHIGHFAFIRAVVQGLDTRASWHRYLRMEGEHEDLRNVKRTIDWIRDEFAAAAKRHNRYGTARLVLIDAARLAEQRVVQPSLEDFAAEAGLEDFSQAEQIAAYEERYGSNTQQQSRRTRLINKQLEALHWLEKLVVQPPLADDPVSAWLNPALARRLEAAAIHTVRQLVERINGIGLRWWGTIPAIGKYKADRISEWLHTHAQTIGLQLGQHVTVKRSQLAPEKLHQCVAATTGIVPLDKLIVPPGLDGTDGSNRSPQALCTLAAENDIQAVTAWIASCCRPPAIQVAEAAATGRTPGTVDPATARQGRAAPDAQLSHTQRAYLKEAERLVLWAVVKRHKPLSSLDSADCQQYLAFIAQPQPAAEWCGPRSRQKWSPLWRPFEGPLSDSAQHYSVRVLKSLFQFLVRHRYLESNPWQAITAAKQARQAGKRAGMTEQQWAFIQHQASLLPATSANRRLRIALQLMRATGMRLTELVTVQAGDLSCTGKPGAGAQQQYWLDRKDHADQRSGASPVPLGQELMAELSAYFQSRGLDADPLAPGNRHACLLGRAVDVAERTPWSLHARSGIDHAAGITPGTLYDQLAAFFRHCVSVQAQTGTPPAAENIRKVSTRWLRQMHSAPDHARR